MGKIHLSDRQWAFMQPLLPPPAHTGRPRADDRKTIEGIVYILTTGCRWQDLPPAYGAPTTVWRWLKHWGEAGMWGVWERVWRAALAVLDRQGQLNWAMAFLDGSCAPAKNGGDKVGLTKKGKGTKWMLVVDGHGLPLGLHLASATTAEVKLAERTLDTIRVPRVRGRPRRRPEQLVADRAYDSSALCAMLRRRGIRLCIPPKRRPANWRAKRGPSRRAQRGVSVPVYGRAELRLAGQLSALADSLGATLRAVCRVLHGRRHADLPASPGLSARAPRASRERHRPPSEGHRQ